MSVYRTIGPTLVELEDDEEVYDIFAQIGQQTTELPSPEENLHWVLMGKIFLGSLLI